MKRKLQWVGLVAAVVLVAGLVWFSFNPPAATSTGEAITAGIVIDDDMRETVNGHYYLWLADCTQDPQSVDDVRAYCRIGRIEVDEETWYQYGRGDTYPRG